MANVLANVLVPAVPPGDLQRSSFDQWVRNTLLSVQANLLPPSPVTNVRATALAGAIKIDFTRSDGDSYTLYKNNTPSTNLSTRIDLGTANTYIDNIGDGAILRYYLVVSKTGGRESTPSAWVSATTLALNTPVVPNVPPPATDTAFKDKETDTIAVQNPSHGSYVPI